MSKPTDAQRKAAEKAAAEEQAAEEAARAKAIEALRREWDRIHGTSQNG